MVRNKFLAMFLSLVLLGDGDCQLRESKNFCPHPEDVNPLKLVEDITLVKGAGLFLQIRDIRVPMTGLLPQDKLIGCISIADLKDDESSGTVEIHDGGPGQNFVIIRITTLPLRNVDMNIQVYYHS